jgi:hypothetical protein
LRLTDGWPSLRKRLLCSIILPTIYFPSKARDGKLVGVGTDARAMTGICSLCSLQIGPRDAPMAVMKNARKRRQKAKLRRIKARSEKVPPRKATVRDDASGTEQRRQSGSSAER